MNKILVLGAGRSSSSLIEFLLTHKSENEWDVTVGDFDENLARQKVGNSENAKVIHFDINDSIASDETIGGVDVVISMLPAQLHPQVAQLCLRRKKHFLSASYVTDKMKSYHQDAHSQGLLFLNECGLDPGIDHMSAMQIIDGIRGRGGNVLSFESFTGGLIAPDTDPENPWRYKFTWNPRNVVMAGQGTAKFLEEGHFKYIPYQQLFQRTTTISVPGYGDFEGYANRDSLVYRETYGLVGIRTMLRGTLRYKGFCPSWNVLVQLGCCDDTFLMDNVDTMTHRGFLSSFLKFDPVRSVEAKLCSAFNLAEDGDEITRLQWSGLFSSEPVGLNQGTPAQILEHILAKKWTLASLDKDLIVMCHRFVYEIDGARKETHASLVAQGDDAINTAMSKTVGLPLAFAAKLLLQGRLQQRGVVIPVHREFYEPILHGLRSWAIELKEW